MEFDFTIDTDYSKKLLTIGEAYIDLLLEVSDVTTKDGFSDAGKYNHYVYGRDAVAALATVKMGGEAAFCAKIGNDADGSKIRRYFDNCKVDTSYITVQNGEQTGLIVTGYGESGKSVNLRSQGANRFLTERDVDDSFCCLPALALLPTCREELTRWTLRAAADRNIPLIVYYGREAVGLDLKDVGNIELCVIPDDAMHAATGIMPTTIEKTLQSLIDFRKLINARYYIVQQGGYNAFVYDGKYYEIIQAPGFMTVTHPDAKYMEQTFIGAMAAEYMKSDNVLRATHIAVITSLLTRASYGALEHAPNLAEITKFISDNHVEIG
ncbi:MAG: carbohydrate kinase family protein [Clostridia bacterium]|nr:carbohydrate kinase family protein [Clostridia bacterium]